MAGENARGQFTFYRSYYDAIRSIPKKEQAAVLLAICAYALDNEEPKLSGTASALFTLIRPTLDTGRKKALGGQRGTPKKDGAKTSERCGKDSANEKEEEKEREIERENECSKESTKEKRAKFIPPTLEQVEAYCKERGNSVDPKRFFDYFNASGWVDGKGNKVRNWKQKVITWESHGKGEQGGQHVEAAKPAERYGTYV